jgi:SPX domain protein involved in polyphosphate accumulation
VRVQGFVRTTTKYWVPHTHVSQVKYKVLQNLPVFQFNVDPNDENAGDAQLVNSVYLDNSLLELYRGRIDKRPGAIAMRIRWCARVIVCVSAVHSARSQGQSHLLSCPGTHYTG